MALTKVTIDMIEDLDSNNSAGAISLASGVLSGGKISYEKLTSSSGTWTVPTGVTVVIAHLCGGGGGGGAGNSSQGGGAGGGSGYETWNIVATDSVSLPAGSLDYTIGAGGSGMTTQTDSTTAKAGNGSQTTMDGCTSAGGGFGGVGYHGCRGGAGEFPGHNADVSHNWIGGGGGGKRGGRPRGINTDGYGAGNSAEDGYGGGGGGSVGNYNGGDGGNGYIELLYIEPNTN